MDNRYLKLKKSAADYSVIFSFVLIQRIPLLRKIAHQILPVSAKHRLLARRRDIEQNKILGVPASSNAPSPSPFPVRHQSIAESTQANHKLDIVCFANIEWSARYQRPQQLMSQFALNGYRVFYIVASKAPPTGQLYSFREVAAGVFEVAIQVHATQNFYGERMTDQNVLTAQKSLEALAKDWRIKTAISVVHLPYWAPLARRLRRDHDWRIQYDCMDDWVDFPHFEAEALKEEEALIAEADLVTVTASLLHEKWSARSRNCLLVRNGVDFDFFSQHCTPNELLPEMQRPIIGFYGALAEWVDFALIAAIADRKPDWNFVLIGDIFVKDLAGLERKRNVQLLGKKPYADMPRYLYRFDVCLIPFRLYNVTHAVDPVKFYEFISAGKPVVSVPLDEMKIYEEFVYFAKDADEFVQKIDLALSENDQDLFDKRVALARANDWKVRFENTRDAIHDLYPKVSVIVVTYNNVELTKLCIDSLLRNTTYPNVELIVVDNASSDDTRNFLRYINRRNPRTKIILNDQNLGFSAANNQGLRIAEGEYLVLLNNDTVVPKGWIDALLRHLDDATIGLIGPVTNSIGNEAKIEVDYQDLGQMEVFADGYIAAHRGHLFDISMLAMFCVAMRREVFEKTGFLDEKFGIGMFEDDDYSRRIHALGLRTVCAEDVFVHHFGQAAFKKLIANGEYQKLWDRNQAYFESKWGKWQAHTHRDSLQSNQRTSNQASLANTAKEPEFTAAATQAAADQLAESPDTVKQIAAKQVTADHWSENIAGSDAFSPDVYWLAVPAVQQRHQRRATAGSTNSTWFQYCVEEFLGRRKPDVNMLSIGCGSGTLERDLFQIHAFDHCDAIDIAPGAIDAAKREAQAIGASSIHYSVTDVERHDLPREHYDAVWFNGSLHHIRELERVCERVRKSLKPGGFLFFNEYVGANHFAFDAQQRDAILHAFNLIPKRFRRSFVAGSFGRILEAAPLPDPVEVARVDPSEAVRSQDIMKVVNDYFDIQAANPCGGSLLQFALHGVAGNFKTDDPASMRILKMLFDIEDGLIDSGSLKSDFVVVAAKPKNFVP